MPATSSACRCRPTGRSGAAARAAPAWQTREEDFVTRLFVANTHTPVLFFSSRGQVYKEKVWRLPLAAPQARGKALINLLPLEQGERITTIMPLPEDEASWGDARRDVRHHRAARVRRNKLSDFVDVRRSGKIAMKLDEGEAIVGVEICTEKDDVLLTTAHGQCIRFPVAEVRVFSRPQLDGRARHRARRGRQGDLAVDPPPCRRDSGEERAAYLKRASAVRRGLNGDAGEGADATESPETPRPRPSEGAGGAIELGEQRYAEMSAAEQFILTISERTATASAPRPSSTASPAAAAKASSPWTVQRSGSSRRSASSSPPSRSRRATRSCWSPTAASSSAAASPRFRIKGRGTQGVIVFETAEDEHVVSVERLSEEGESENGNGDSDGETGQGEGESGNGGGE